MMKRLPPLLFLLLPFFVHAQKNVVDSLNTVIRNAKDDTTKVLAQFLLMEELYTSHPDTVIPMCNMVINRIDRDLPKANDIEKNSFLTTKAMAMNDLATMYSEHGQYEKSLDYNFKSLAIKEHMKNKRGIANSLLNIGYNYQQLGNTSDALDSYMRGLKMQQEIKNKNGIAVALYNIASLYLNQGDTLKALDFDSQTLKLYQEINNKRGIAYTLNNIGSVYDMQGKTQQSLDYYNKSLVLQKELNDKEGIATGYNNIGGCYFRLKKYSVALSYSDSSLSVGEKLGYISILRNAHRLQSKVYEEMGNIKEAFDHYKKYILYRDSVNSIQSRKASMKQQLKYEFDKKATADSIKNAKADEIKDARIKAQTAQNNQQKTQLYALYGGLFLVIVFSFFLFNRFRVTQKQKLIIENQKSLVEEKQKEILDSIHYAKRIQQSLLPTEKYIGKNLNRLNKD